MKNVSFTNFLGINNRLPDFKMRVATKQLNGQYLRVADNVDINDSGNLVRRNGTALVQAMTGAHSLFDERLLVRDSVLYAVTLPTYTEALLKVLSSNAKMSFVQIGGDTYYSNGTDSGRISPSGAVYPLGLPTPAAPTLSNIGGALLPGAYQVAVSQFNNATGEEGGVSPSVSATLTTTNGLRVTLPAVAVGATHINVYLSAANGSVPFLVGSFVGTTYDIVALATGHEASERFEAPLPAGTLFTSNNRLCSFAAGVVYIGLPYRHGYYLPAEGYIPFPADVSIAIENQGGTFIAADKTYWIPGDLGDVQGQLADVLPYGAVPGTAFEFPDKSLVGWFGANGIVFGATSGEVEAVMSENVDLTAPTSGTAIVLQSNGFDRVVSCGWCLNMTTKAATTYSDWAFTSVSGDYGTKTDGIYRINADSAVDSTVGLGKEDFGNIALKHLPAAYLGVDSECPMRLRVQAPGGVDYEYVARSSGAELKQQRIDPGKGLRANWFDLTLYNMEGAAFTLASINIAAAAESRRI